ncbi:glycosyltransferase family 90 protein [Schizophyllum fasciatum]
MLRRARRILRLLAAPKTRRLLRAVLLVASIYLLLSLALRGHVASTEPRPAGLRERARAAGASTHQYQQNGLLAVNPLGAHPIYELMARADAQWRRKHARASRTLAQAVREYRRRYRRDPPRGFDLWWEFAQKHNVQLPDEYDQIYWDFEHMWGVYPPDLIAMQQEAQDANTDDWAAIGRSADGHVDVLHTSFNAGNDHLIASVTPVLDLLKGVEDYLPQNFSIMISPHDAPQRHTDYDHRRALREAARHKTYLKRDELPPVKKGLGWPAACHPSSPGRHYEIDLDREPPPREGKTFIHDHYKSMSPCQHTHLFHHHGQFVSHGAGPDPAPFMAAQFAYAASAVHHDIRMPAPYDWVADLPGEPAWAAKTDGRLLWRGSTTGMLHDPAFRWRMGHRLRMVGLANANGTAPGVRVLESRGPGERVGQPRVHRAAELNAEVMDVAFAGRAHQCTTEAICEEIEETYEFRSYQTLSEAANYKYIMDVDGNAWSGRFKRLMLANSVIFKATIYPEWYTDRVQPWLHYVPVQMDYSDLYDSLIFFRGDEHGVGAHDDLAEKIAVQGRKWSKEYWRMEDLQAYFIRSLLEYARLMSEDREAMSYHGPGSA